MNAGPARPAITYWLKIMSLAGEVGVGPPDQRRRVNHADQREHFEVFKKLLGQCGLPQLRPNKKGSPAIDSILC